MCIEVHSGWLIFLKCSYCVENQLKRVVIGIKIDYKEIKDLKEYENNPRFNNKAVDKVAKSIKEFGFKVPIVVDKNNVIVAGHTRLKAAKKLKMNKVPVIVADDLNEEQIKAFRLADNKVAEFSEWDDDLLKLELDSLNFDMTDFGFEIDIETTDEVVEDNFEIELSEEPKARIGDVYQLGNHFLMCGDSTKKEDVSKLMNGNLADLVLTDPPYNMNYQGAGNSTDRASKKIKNDNLPDDVFEKFLTDVYKNINMFLKDKGSFYVFYKELGTGVFVTSVEKAGLTFKQNLIWVKNHLVLGGSKYQNIYESCVFGCKGKSVGFWYGKRNKTSVIEHFDLMNEDELRGTIKQLFDDLNTDIVRVDKTLKNDLHPTMKPIKLLTHFINNSSKIDDVILDLFGGSGSTMVACEQLNRVCYMMEYDPKFVDVIIKRWEDFTGKKAKLL